MILTRRMADSVNTKTLTDLGWPRLIAELCSRCHTTRGEAAARALIPGDDLAVARERAVAISEARLLWQLAEPMPFGAIRDVVTEVSRAEKGGDLEGVELYAIGQTLAGCARLRRHIMARAAQIPRLAARIAEARELGDVAGPILDSFDDDGRLADHASPALGPMRRKVAALHEELGRRVKDLLDDPDIAPHLQDRFYTRRDDRYVVPLRADARGRVKGIVHGTSQSGHTVFVEPERVVELNNRLKMAESEVIEEERRILAELSGYVREEAPAIFALLDAAEALDLLDAAARLADAMNASAPEIDVVPGLLLKHARHPLMVLGGRPCVANDLVLAAGTTLVVSGPNAGGKTVALKTIGLAALSARAGLHVAADPGAQIPWYVEIETDIGDDQSLERNLSTFSAHVLNITRFLASAGPKALLLIDELAVGTDPDQGAALAQAVLEAFAAAAAQAVVTTPNERVEALATHDARFVNASVGFDLERMAPTFRLHAGVPGSSGAFWVARRLGLETKVVARAEELLGDRRAGIEELLTAVAEERRRLDIERGTMDTARREAERARRDAEAAERSWKAREEKLRRGAWDDALAALRRVRDEADELKKRLKKSGGGGDDLGDVRAEIDGLRARMASLAPAEDSLPGKPATAADLVTGARVIVPKLGGKGQVVSPPERGRVMVQIGGLKTAVGLDEVRLDDAPTPNRGVRRRESSEKAKPTPPRAPGPPVDPVLGAIAQREADLAPARTSDATCDIRGERADEALVHLERFLDDSLLASREVVFVIHGHGTGAWRTADRAELDVHPGVSRWRPGGDKEGGDGITIVWMDV